MPLSCDVVACKEEASRVVWSHMTAHELRTHPGGRSLLLYSCVARAGVSILEISNLQRSTLVRVLDALMLGSKLKVQDVGRWSLVPTDRVKRNLELHSARYVGMMIRTRVKLYFVSLGPSRTSSSMLIPIQFTG